MTDKDPWTEMETAAMRDRPDKPFHKAECKCHLCLAWIAANPISEQPALKDLPDEPGVISLDDLPAYIGRLKAELAAAREEIKEYIRVRDNALTAYAECTSEKIRRGERIVELEAENAKLRSDYNGISGALADAGDVTLYAGDLARSVRELVAERDRLRDLLEEV